ncbi:hypothetical protein Tco_0124472, partial [Tanacetum coccineum]
MSNRHQELTSPKQTAIGKDFSNPLIVDSLLKTIWSSMDHVFTMKHWLIQSKRLLKERTSTEVFQDQESSEKGSAKVSTAGAKKGTASEEVPIVSTDEVNLSTAGETITYTRRSAEKRLRQDKGKAIMIESEPKKKSMKELEQERLSFA